MRKKPLIITNYPIVSNKIPKAFHGFRIAVMSDLHDCCIGCENEILLEQVRIQSPDAILLAGDMITEEKMGNGRVHQENAAHLLQELASIAPTYYGMGNHEQRWKEIPRENIERESFDSWMRRLESWGITLLDNRSVIFHKGEGRIRITGLALPNRYFTKKKIVRLSREEIENFVGPADTAHFQILMGHTPQFYDAYMNWGADLALAGHYHGGVVRLPVLGGVISTNFRPFPKYDYGAYPRGQQSMIVSSGLGCHTIPIRVNNPPELILMELKGEEPNGAGV